MENEVGSNIAQALNCSLGHFPIKYLLQPVSDLRLKKAKLSDPVSKVANRLQTWKCGCLSYGCQSKPD